MKYHLVEESLLFNVVYIIISLFNVCGKNSFSYCLKFPHYSKGWGGDSNLIFCSLDKIYRAHEIHQLVEETPLFIVAYVTSRDKNLFCYCFKFATLVERVLPGITLN